LPYVVLKLGFGPNLSLVSAFLGFVCFSAWGRRRAPSSVELNAAQAAGTSAGTTAFFSVLLAAFDLLNAKPELGFALHLQTLEIFLWFSLAGTLGVFLAIPFRRHFIDDEALPFVGGAVAGETILALSADTGQARSRTRALGLGFGVAAVVAACRSSALKLIPEVTAFSASLEKLRMGMGWSLLSFGSGMLIGVRVTLSMGLGMVLSWLVLPPWLLERGYIAEPTFAATLRWVMWPATGLMVSGGLTTLLLSWRKIVKALSSLRLRHTPEGPRDHEVPLAVTIGGVVLLTIALCVVQSVFLGMSVFVTLASIALSFPLILIGTRVLGETNYAPISALANAAQGALGVFFPGSIAINMVGSGLAGLLPASGEHLMQNQRATRVVGGRPDHTTAIHVMAVCVGALMAAWVYPLLRDRYGLGEQGLSSPASVKWAGFAELLSRGVEGLAPGSLPALAVGLALGVVLALLEPRFKSAVPSATGIGMGMLTPGAVVLPMVLGGLAGAVWRRRSPSTEQVYQMPLASGFVAGEAIVALVVPILGLLKR
ncbi:MAG: OPT/YSL family transporter, partial [Archangium sp.]|nr:OPT/YSL family transporter [Archangium sp.]